MKNRKKCKPLFFKWFIAFFSWIMAACYGSLFIYVLFFARRRRELQDRYVTIVPLKSTIGNYIKIDGNEHYELFNYYTNFLGNIILFLPLPIFLACLAGVHSFRKIFLLSFILSFSVELLQFIFKKGVADIDDILLNLLGTTIGFSIYKILWSAKT